MIRRCVMKKRIYGLMAAFAVLLLTCMTYADSFPVASYSGKPVTVFGNINYVISMNTGLEGASDASYAAQDPSMLEIISTQVWNKDRVPLCVFRGKKAGQTAIQVSVKSSSGDRSIAVPVIIVPYENPFKSFMIGGVDVAPQFAKALTGSYTGNRGKQRVSYTCKPGWEATAYYVDNDYNRFKIPSGSEVDLTDIYSTFRLKRIYMSLSQPSTGNAIDLTLAIADRASAVTPIPDLPAAPTPVPVRPDPTATPTPKPTATPTPKPTATPTPTPTPEPVDESVQEITFSNTTVEFISKKHRYNGKPQTPGMFVILKKGLDQKYLELDKDYVVSYTNNVEPGIATLTIEGIGAYTGTYTETFKISKGVNPFRVNVKDAVVKASKLAKKKLTIKKSDVFSVKKAKGKVTFKKKSGSKALSVTSKGDMKVKKGTKKGTYTMKVSVTAAGNEYYEKGNQTVTVSVKVK